MCILVSRDGDIETKINGLNTANKDSRIIVPFTYAEILQMAYQKRILVLRLENTFIVEIYLL